MRFVSQQHTRHLRHSQALILTNYTYTLQPAVAESVNEEDNFIDSEDSGEQLDNLEENDENRPSFVEID